MPRKNDSTILILVAAGLGIYYYMRNKATSTPITLNEEPLVETGFPPGGGSGEGTLVDYTPAYEGFSLRSPPNPSGGGGGNVYLETPVGRGGGYMTDMFESILDTSRNIDKDRMYEK